MYGRWAKAFSLLFGIATLLGTLALYRAWRDCRRSQGSRSARPLARAAAGGVRGIRVHHAVADAKAIVYHEAPLWAVGLAIWATVFVVRFWPPVGSGDLVAAGSLAFFVVLCPRFLGARGCWRCWRATAVLARPPSGAGGAGGASRCRDAGGDRPASTSGTTGCAGATRSTRSRCATTSPTQGARIEHIHGRIFNIAAVPRNFLNYWMAPTVERSPSISMGPLSEDLAGRDSRRFPTPTSSSTRACAATLRRLSGPFRRRGWWSPSGACAGIREP